MNLTPMRVTVRGGTKRCGQGSLVLVALVLLLPQPAQAKDLYVDNSGSPACSDATTHASNSAASPWCTVGRAAWGSTDPNVPAVSQAAQAGDVVHIIAGTYQTVAPRTVCGSGARWEVALNPANSGTSGAPITFVGEGTVNIYLAAGYVGPTIGSNGRDYIVWDNIRIDEQTAPGASCPDTGPVVLQVTTGSKILGCTIRGTYRAWGDNYNGIRTEAVNGAVVANNTIYEITGDWGHNDAAIMLYDTANSVFEHNRIYDSVTGIYIKGDHASDGWPQTNNTFRFNWLENLSSKAILSYDSSGSQISQNIFKDSPYGVRQYGVSVNANVSIVNNTFISTGAYGTAAAYSVYGDAAALTNLLFFNNIAVGPFGEALNMGDVAVIGGQSLEHNVYFGYSAFGSLNGSQFSFATWQSTHGQDSASPAGIVADPLFLDATYRLQSSSPAWPVGVDVLDLDGDGSATDIIPAGAYITGNELIGPGGTVSPSPDGGVVVPDAGAVPPDAAVLPPDAAVLPPDAAVLPPDAVVVPPDAAVLPPDAAVLPPDAGGPPSPDAAVIDGTAGDGPVGDHRVGDQRPADGSQADQARGDTSSQDGALGDGLAPEPPDGESLSGGCGCSTGGGVDDLGFVAVALLVLGARIRRRRG